MVALVTTPRRVRVVAVAEQVQQGCQALMADTGGTVEFGREVQAISTPVAEQAATNRKKAWAGLAEAAIPRCRAHQTPVVAVVPVTATLAKAVPASSLSVTRSQPYRTRTTQPSTRSQK